MMNKNYFIRNKYFSLALLMCLLIACNIPMLSQFLNEEVEETNPVEEPSLPEPSNLDSQDSESTPSVTLPDNENETALPSSPSTGPECSLFVASDGDDNNPGSEGQPWRSFQKAAEAANPGDTVCFRGGTYATDNIYLAKSGQIDEPITYAAYPGEIPILDGDELLTLGGGISHLRISGFVLRNFNIWGIFLSGENHYITLDHLEIEGGEAGIRFTYGETDESPPAEGPVEYILLEDSRISGSQYTAVDCSPGPCNHMTYRRLEIFNTGISGEAFYGSDGIAVDRGHHVLVEDCYIHDNGGDGIDLGSRDRDGNIEGVIVRRNRVVRNHRNGIKVWAGGRIENNVVWGQGDIAIFAGIWNSTIEMINNTVAYNMWDPSYSERNWAVVIGYPGEIPKPEVNLTMVNNIFAYNTVEGGPTGVYIGPGVQLNESHNLYFSRVDGEITFDKGSEQEIWVTRQEIIDGTWESTSGGGEGDLIVDPLFISGWPDVDLRLQPNSPAINAGDKGFAPDEDVMLNLRDDEPNMGAYEFD
ncbi:MAG: right-handed parallel beta-helix repeat-containing protein [Brevefilum sp.]|nr:right-handed parallel beta-helix repeat-containing protein [Brevefilum sp.]